MKIRRHRPLFALLFAILCVSTGRADTIDPNKPIGESLKPSLLYFDFDEESEGSIASKGEMPLSASIEPGKVDTYPSFVPGRNEAFGKAMAFNYGVLPPFTEPNDMMAGNHLDIPDKPELRLAGESFTVGAWVQMPEDADLDLSGVRHKMLLGKGGFSNAYPGWGFQVSYESNHWSLTLLLVGPNGDRMRADAPIPEGLSPGVWHHVAASFDAVKQEVTLWVDGVRTVSRKVDGDLGESTFPLVIGERGLSTYCNIPITMDDVFITSGVHDFKPVEQ